MQAAPRSPLVSSETKDLTINVEKIKRMQQQKNKEYQEGIRMLKEMMKPRFKGQTIEISLSKWGYKGYCVECTYHFDKQEGRYSLSLWLIRKDTEDRMKLSSKEVDTQYLSGTRETIVENICKVVHQAATAVNDNGEKYLDRFVARYEYELACFERGNELFEQERPANAIQKSFI